MQFNTPYGLADDQSASYFCGLQEGLAIGAITGGVNSGAGAGGSIGGSGGIFNGECVWKCAKEINLEATVSYSGYDFQDDAVIAAYAAMYSQYGFPYTISVTKDENTQGDIIRRITIATSMYGIRHERTMQSKYNPKKEGFSYPVKRQNGVWSGLFYGESKSSFYSTGFFDDANRTETEDSITMRLGVVDAGGIFVPAMGLGAKNGMRYQIYPDLRCVVAGGYGRNIDGSGTAISYTSPTIHQAGSGELHRLCAVDPSQILSEEDRQLYGVGMPKIDGEELLGWYPLTRVNGSGFIGNMNNNFGIWIKPLNEDIVYYAQVYIFSGCPHAHILGSTTPDAIDFYNL